MKVIEYVQEYHSTVFGIVSHVKIHGEPLNNENMVCKVLRSPTIDFDHLVAAIEESKDLSTYSFDELMGSLLAHEVRMNRSCEKVEEKAFQMKGESNKVKLENLAVRNQGRGSYHG